MAGGNEEPLALWPGLKESVSNGDVILNDPYVAFDCATLCGDLMTGFYTVSLMVPEVVIKNFGSLGSGAQWAMALYEYTAQCKEIITDKHIPQLRDMFDTFRTAGLTYQAAEDESAQIFKDLTNLAVPSAMSAGTSHYGSSYSPGISNALGYVEEQKFDQPVGMSGGLIESTGVQPANWDIEHPWDLTHEDLYELGKHIADNNLLEHCNSLAEKWWRASESLNAILGEFGRSLSNTVDDGNWEGAGKDAAEGACTAYVSDAQQLATAISLVSDCYSYAGDRLEATRKEMPTLEYDPSGFIPLEPPGPYDERLADAEWAEYKIDRDVEGGAYIEDRFPHFIGKWVETYEAGFIAAGPKMPVLPELTGAAENNDTAGEEETANTGYGGGGGGGYDGGNLGASSNLKPAFSVGEDLARQIEAAREEVRQQAGDLAEQQAAMQQGQGISQMLGQGAQQLASGVEKALQESQRAMEQAAQRHPTAGLHDPYKSPIAGLAHGAGHGGGGSGAGGVSAPKSPDAGRLFPRAGAAGPGGPAVGSTAKPAFAAGAAPGTQAGSPMMPPGAGGAGQGGKKDEKKHDRAAYLNSTVHMEEALGGSPSMTKPIVGAKAAAAQATRGQSAPKGTPEQPVPVKPRPRKEKQQPVRNPVQQPSPQPTQQGGS